VLVSTNGVKVDEFRKIDALGLPRNPRKLVYASSPDRGLRYLLPTFAVAREAVPDLELHVFYGFDNIDKLPENPAFPYLRRDIQRGLDQPGVINHGRVGQPELWKHYATAGIWPYQTTFTETSCISSMEAQALGAIPITNPLWALRENVQFGVLIPGDCWNDELVKARYAEEIVRLVLNERRQEEIRPAMMDYARMRFNWERVVDQFEGWILDLPPCVAQYTFQHRYATGKILNVGCNNDSTGFAQHRDAVNVDISKVDPYTKEPNAAHLIMDSRDLLFKPGSFDTVILGEILEHMDRPDVIKSLQEAARVLTPNGQIVVTVPEDHRTSPEQKQYSGGIRAYHDHAITPAEAEGWAKDAGLEIRLTQPIDLTFCTGWGFVLKKPQYDALRRMFEEATKDNKLLGGLYPVVETPGPRPKCTVCGNEVQSWLVSVCFKCRNEIPHNASPLNQEEK
jgi:SAM-dependent methyltransferase